MNNIVRIVAAILDTSTLTLYKQDGSTVVIKQGDPRVRKIVETVPSQIARQGYADVDLYQENEYQRFEEETKGTFKFFKVAREKLKGWFGSKEATPISAVIGTKPTPQEKTEAMSTALAQIMEHAVPVTSNQFTEDGVNQQREIAGEDGHTPSDKNDKDDSSHTMIALTPDNTLVAGIEKIKTQFVHAVQTGSTKGMEAFLARAGKVATERKHSVQDLLKFMERGDLPIADDGSILIYKVLSKKGDKYVDCHTRNVEQWVGAYVHMDPSLVDHNRNNECSNGLHVARRGYIRQFSGSVCTLCKVAPEDVIAVPAYDANKMRVCGYHIIAELTPEQFSLVKLNKPITDVADGAVLLANAIAGNHIGITDKVKIGGQQGTNVTFEKVSTPEPVVEVVIVEPVKALENPGTQSADKPVAVKAVAEAAKKAVKEAPKAFKPAAVPKAVNGVVTGTGSPRERIQKLMAIGLTSVGVAQAILKLKKDAKKGWAALGITDEQAAEINRIAGV